MILGHFGYTTPVKTSAPVVQNVEIFGVIDQMSRYDMVSLLGPQSVLNPRLDSRFPALFDHDYFPIATLQPLDDIFD